MFLKIFSGVCIVVAIILFFIEIKKDKTKTVGMFFSVLLFILGIVIPLILDKDKEGTPVTTDPPVIVDVSEPSSDSPSEPPTEPPTEKPITDKPVTDETIENNEISLNFTTKEQEISKIFEAPISGKYRFNFDIDDVNCNYEIELYDSRNDKLFIAYSSQSGISYRLTKGETYRIVITQHSGFTTGKVEIKVPEAEKVLVLK